MSEKLTPTETEHLARFDDLARVIWCTYRS